MKHNTLQGRSYPWSTTNLTNPYISQIKELSLVFHFSSSRRVLRSIFIFHFCFVSGTRELLSYRILEPLRWKSLWGGPEEVSLERQWRSSDSISRCVKCFVSPMSSARGANQNLSVDISFHTRLVLGVWARWQWWHQELVFPIGVKTFAEQTHKLARQK